MAKRSQRRPDASGANRQSSRSNPILAGVAARLAEVTELLRSGRWHAPSAGEDPADLLPPDDDGGLATSGVRRRPPDTSGSGSAALIEPLPDDVLSSPESEVPGAPPGLLGRRET